MKKLKELTLKSKRVYRVMFFAFILICFFVGISCVTYYRQVQNTLKTEGSEYMQEISRQMATNVTRTIMDNFSVLNTIAASINTLDINSYEQLQKTVKEQKQIWNYQKILLIDEKGVAYDDKGGTIALNSDQYLQDAVVHGKESMSTSQVIDGKECIVFAIPLQNIEIEDIKMKALVTCYDLDSFDKILSMNAFSGKGYAHIIRRDGTIVVRSSSENALQTGYNILNSLSEGKLNDRKQITEIKAEIEGGKSGQTEFTLNGSREFMTYAPLGTQEWSILTFVPVSVVNEKSNMLLRITILLCSSIMVVFTLLFASLMLTYYRNKKKLEVIAYVDPITKGNTIQRFYELAQEELRNISKLQYALIYTNIEKFKVLNEQFGKAACDEILRSFESGIGADLSEKECMGRLAADNFCVLIEYQGEEAMVRRLEQWYKGCVQYMERIGAVWLPLITEFGAYVITDAAMPLSQMIDRAKLSLSEKACELRGKLRYAIFDERVRKTLFREKQLEDMMEEALRQKEFQVFLQPKYKVDTEQIGGAEALVRWKSAAEGMIFPDEFIPLFEKNGFVVQIDMFVYEEVCRTIRRWLDEGKEPVKISVNCSRIHLRNMEFLNLYCKIADKYAIPRHYIEIELTENTVFEDVGYLSQIISQIQAAGFGCSMDDFGSGYSSLNMIKDIPVDTLKLDKIFFRNGVQDMQRTESVVGSIISMSKALSMQTVAEGVEEREQVDMLKRLGCDFIQGYFFARPMPITEFEALAF